MRFRSDPAKITGSIAPVVSPFNADGSPDTGGLRALIRWQLESGSHGISLGGSTGEPSVQTTAERAAAKWVLHQAGLIASPFVRPPLVPLTPQAQPRVLELLKEGAPVLDGPVARVPAAGTTGRSEDR
ncbi:MAG TPA: dihydrodipicolinate synthase family protein [Trebonia sp.]|jgi:dihydrodipicolinate synthase/N-acetylneuraminate lyase